MAAMSSFSVNENSAVYYEHTYWNDLPQVRDEINRRVSGDPQRFWFHRFSELVEGRVFKRALILNCGNGNVERGLFDNGLIAECVGIDYSHELLDQARRDNADHPARYHQMDVNTAAFPDEEFDLVVNFAAAHHIARIDKVFRALCERLPDDGWFVSYDYVGPHRNQYGYDIWDAAHRLNQTLPPEVRQDLRYPHLPTMLATDPTEAIHAELILETFQRYFTEVERRPAGGALAYLLLTHNHALFAADPAVRDRWVQRILDADGAHLAAHPEATLFAYFAGQPRKAVLEQAADLARWTAEEEAREDRALSAGGEYYPHSALQDLHLQLEDQRAVADHGHELAVARAELEMLRGTFPFPQWQRLKDGRVGAAVRRNPTVERVARGVLARARARTGG
jgi:SAM-dependent methyltransferase